MSYVFTVLLNKHKYLHSY